MISWEEPVLAAYVATFSSAEEVQGFYTFTQSSVVDASNEARAIQTTTTATTEAIVAVSTSTSVETSVWSSTSTTSTYINSNGGSATSSVWTTSVDYMSSTVETWVTSESTTNTTIVSELTDSTIGNVARTIYEAESNEVLLVAQNSFLSAWNGVGLLPQTTTRTTIDPDVITTELARLNLLVEDTESASTTFGSEIAYNRSSSVLTTITTANLNFLPQTTRTVQVVSVSTSQTTTGEEVTLTAEWEQGASMLVTQDLYTSQTVSRFNGTVSYADTIARRSTIESTKQSPVVVTFATSQSTDAIPSGSTEAGGGETTLSNSEPRFGLHTITGQVSWSVFGYSGAVLNTDTGLRYAMTNSALSSVKLADLRSGNNTLTKLVSVLPSTNSDYSAGGTGITFTRTTQGSASSTTSSVSINLSGSGVFTLIGSRTGLLGGVVADNETVVQRARRGVYIDEFGSSTFLDGNDSSYIGNGGGGTKFYKPAPMWVGDGLYGRVRAVKRNETLLPPIVPQGGAGYPSF